MGGKIGGEIMKRKKRGNSLIVVVTTCMFVTTVSAATLSMVSGNYKARVVESKRVENLYSSDSGLDVSYNIIGKTFDAATKYGYYEVEALKSDAGNSKSPYNDQYKNLKKDILDKEQTIQNIKNTVPMTSDVQKIIAECNEQIQKDNNEIDDTINDEFKRTFQNFINGTNIEGISEAEEGSTYNLKAYISQGSYVNAITYNDTSQDKPFTFNIAEVTYPSNSSPQLSIPDNGLNYDSSSGKYTITIQSRFSTTGGNTAVIGENSRIVQATYAMTVPDYKDIFYQQVSGELHEYLALKDRALTVGRNMNINGANSLEINGNVFVQGYEPTTSQSDRVYEKYNGGIAISDSSSVKFDDDVVTRNTFNIQSSADATVGGNIYGRNVYVGNIAAGDSGFAKGATLNVNNGGVILDNDLALKANSSTINIKDFYGINDKNVSYDDLNTDSSQHNIISGGSGDKVKSSSSIIVNGNDDKTSININTSAYIMGTAHIDTIDTTGTGSHDGYQTGESGAVKGNYIAYSVPLSEAEKFDYYEPMQLLDDSNVFNKANHFASYWNGKAPATGGIHLPSNTYSVGAIVYEDSDGNKKVMRPNYSQALEASGGIIYNKRIDFASKVYKFGQDATITDYNNSNLTSFGSLMDFTGISKANYDITKQTDNGEYAIFNADTSKEIQIKQSSEATDSIKVDSNGIIEVNVAKKDNGYTLNAVIATAGNVSIEDDDIILNGNIICNGDLNITGKSVKINYDEDAIDIIQTQNYELFENVFGNSMLGNLETTPASTSDATDSGTITSLDITYDLKKFLQSNKWKIIK